MVFREECENRFTLATKALIMDYKLKSFADIGKVDLSIAMDIIKGKADLLEDMDQATKMMIEEVIAIVKGNKRKFRNKSVVTAREFVSFWPKVSEHTHSSVSELHYGTHKAAAKDLMISEALAGQPLVARSEVFPKRRKEIMQVVVYTGIVTCTMDNMR